MVDKGIMLAEQQAALIDERREHEIALKEEIERQEEKKRQKILDEMQQRMVRTQAALEGKTNTKIESSEKKVVGMTKEMEDRLAAEMEANKKKVQKQNKELVKQLDLLTVKFSTMDVVAASNQSRSPKKSTRNAKGSLMNSLSNSAANTPTTPAKVKPKGKKKKMNKKVSSKKAIVVPVPRSNKSSNLNVQDLDGIPEETEEVHQTNISSISNANENSVSDQDNSDSDEESGSGSEESGSDDEEEEEDDYDDNFFDEKKVDLTNYFTKDEVKALVLPFSTMAKVLEIEKKLDRQHYDDFKKIRLQVEAVEDRFLFVDDTL